MPLTALQKQHADSVTQKAASQSVIGISCFEMLSCPRGCGKGLDLEKQEQLDSTDTTLICPGCGARFPVCDGIPVMFSDRKNRLVRAPSRRRPFKSKLSKLKQVLLDYSTPQYYYLKKFMKDFSEKCGAVGVLIDIGCGCSPFTKKFSADNLVLADIVQRGDVDVLSDVQALAFRDNCADLVLLTEVLEHVEDERKALSEIHRILRQYGWLVLTVPFTFGIHETADYRRWTAQGLAKLLQEQGFVVVDLRCRGGCFSSLLCLWRDVPKELLGGNFQSRAAKLLLPLIGLHLFLCSILTPFVIMLDKLDRKNLSPVGYAVLCQKTSK